MTAGHCEASLESAGLGEGLGQKTCKKTAAAMAIRATCGRIHTHTKPQLHLPIPTAFQHRHLPSLTTSSRQVLLLRLLASRHQKRLRHPAGRRQSSQTPGNREALFQKPLVKDVANSQSDVLSQINPAES